MGNFEKLSVLVIVVIIVMILVVALYTWTEDPNAGAATATAEKQEGAAAPAAPGSGVNRVELPATPKGGGAKTPLAGAPGKNDGKAGNGLGAGFAGFEGLFPPSKSPEGKPADGKAPEGAVAGPVIDPGVTPPSGAADPASAKPAEPRFHVVVAGDSYARIAKKEYPGMGQRAIDELIKANPTIEPSRMREGQKIVLPELAAAAPASGAGPVPGAATVKPAVAELRPGSIYVVRQGDTLPGISKRAYSNAGRWQDIWIENFSAIDDPDHLHAGTRLKLPK